MKIGIINGPNLNLLGKREVDIYGHRSFDDYLEDLKKEFPEIELHYFQSNSEGDLVSKIQEWGFELDGLVINGASYTHTSLAMGDAIAAVPAPAVEVHISNVSKREDFRKNSYLAANCVGCLTGFGLHSYYLAVKSLQLMQ